MAVATLNYESIQPEGAKRCIIWLHGLGADGFNFMPLVPALDLKHTEYIFPHAPVRPVTINMGMSTRAWFDIYALDNLEREDEAGMMHSREAIMRLIEEAMIRGYDSRDIFLVGFSQGGVMTLLSGLTAQVPLGGLLALSCYLPMPTRIFQKDTAVNRDTPIFMAHGYHDDILPFPLAQESAQILEKAGYDVSWHEYAMGHQVCDQEIQDIKAFIERHT